MWVLLPGVGGSLFIHYVVQAVMQVCGMEEDYRWCLEIVCYVIAKIHSLLHCYVGCVTWWR